jgi:arylsulfatase A-like enzyme
MYRFLLLSCIISLIPAPAGAEPPNIILMMADDLGWGDVAYNGHERLLTPHLDQMAREGIRFNRFYAAAPVCSPTRGSCLTGRHPYRYGVLFANTGHLPPEEPNLAEFLKSKGYATGHFGKWHLGTLTKDVVDANRGGRKKNDAHYAPPWERFFDVTFSTESKVPTFDPMIKPKEAGRKYWNAVAPDEETVNYNTRYWTGPGEFETENLEGDDSRIIMDRVIPFVRENAKREKPFFAVVWFHAPHWPVVADETHREPYKDLDDFHQNHFGCITALDEQVGRLRSELRTLDVSDNTLLCFCSDNGPEGSVKTGCGSAGPLRGRKRDLYEGGIRVPGLLVWPARFPDPKVIDVPCCTSDYFPTIKAILETEPTVGGTSPVVQKKPFDGINLLPVLEGTQTERGSAIGFRSRKQIAWIGDRHKLYSGDNGKTWHLYDLDRDAAEQHDLAASQPDRVNILKSSVRNWLDSLP